MVKTIQIGNDAYLMKSSAYTMFAYKDFTGRDLLKDIGKLQKLTMTDDNLEQFGEVLEIVEQLAYVMHCEATEKKISFHEFLRGMDGILENITWIQEVMELAMSTFQRRVSVR